MLKYIDFCYYNSTECTNDYYLGEEEYKPMTLTEAIAHAKKVAATKCDECGKEHAQLADWLQELAAFKDETLITRDYLKLVCNNLKTNDYIKLSFGEYDEDDFYILVQYINDVHEMCTEYHPVMQWKCPVHTVGQLRMFLTMFGFGDFAQQLKA